MVFGVLGAAYAYFVGNLASNGTSNAKINANSVGNLVFTKGNNISLSANPDNFGIGSGNQTSTTTSTAKLTGGNSGSVTLYYTAIVYISENDMVYTDGTTPELTLTVTKNGTTLINNMDITTSSGAIVIPTASGGTVTRHTITAAASATTTDTWAATITFVNLATDQSTNGHRTVNAILYLDEDPVVPTEYQKVEYIESDGNQVIAYPIFDNFVIYDDVQFNLGTARQLLSFTNGTGAGQFWGSNTNGNYEVGPTSSSSNIMPINSLNRNIVKLTRANSNNKITVNVNGRTISRTGSAAISNFSYYMFGYGSYKATMKRYGTKVYTAAGELKGSLVPCYRKSDSVIGMFDVVTNTFYPNTGTGSFTKGRNV